MRSIFVSLILMSGVLSASAKDCSVNHYDFIWGSDTSTQMTVKSGSVCASHINQKLVVKTSEVVQPAGNGTVSIPDNNHWTYKPYKGFVGKDAFVVAISGEGTRRARVYSGTTRISVDVEVVQ